MHRLGKNQIKEKAHRKQASIQIIGYFPSLHNSNANFDSEVVVEHIISKILSKLLNYDTSHMEHKSYYEMRSKIQAGLVLHVSALTLLENLHYSSNLRDNFQFNVIWHCCSMATCTFCRRLTESDVTVTVSPSIAYMD